MDKKREERDWSRITPSGDPNEIEWYPDGTVRARKKGSDNFEKKGE